MINLTNNLDSYIVSIVKNYNNKEEGVCEVTCREEIIKAISGMYGKQDTVLKLIECIETLVINDLDVGDAYYTKTEGEPTLKKFMVNEARLRQANESRGKMKNEIDKLLEQIAGIPEGQSNKRVTNIDSFSAYMDRLATERIKEYNFKFKQNKDTEAYHQVNVVKVVLKKIKGLFNEINLQGGYNYIGEKRTFDEGKLIADVNQVVKQLKNDQL
tara:strand:- start:1021 stop:1662 length:642 start_codon:yes stop_codon:yes gene_type:complete